MITTTQTTVNNEACHIGTQIPKFSTFMPDDGIDPIFGHYTWLYDEKLMQYYSVFSTTFGDFPEIPEAGIDPIEGPYVWSFNCNTNSYEKWFEDVNLCKEKYGDLSFIVNDATGLRKRKLSQLKEEDSFCQEFEDDLLGALPFRSTPSHIRRSKRKTSHGRYMRESLSRTSAMFQDYLMSPPYETYSQMGLMDGVQKLDVTPKLEAHLSQFNNTLQELVNGIGSLGEHGSFKKINASIDEFREAQVNGEFDTTTILEKMKLVFLGENFSQQAMIHLFGSGSLLIFAVSGIHYAFHRDSTSLTLCSIAGIGAVTYVSSQFGPKIMDIIYRLSSTKDQTVPQFDDGNLDDIATSIITLLGLAVVHKSPDSSKILSGARSLASFGGMKKSMLDISRTVIKFLEYCVNGVRTHFMDAHPMKLVLTKSDTLNTFLLDVDMFCCSIDKREILISVQSLDYANALLARGNAIQRTIGFGEHARELSTALNNTLQKLEKVRNRFVAASPGLNGIRKEPVSVLFQGGPGATKSLALMHLAHALMSATLSKKEYEDFVQNPDNIIHNRQAENGYWEGFNASQQVIMYDDLGQSKTIAGQPDNEFSNIFRSHNMFPHNVHMADISSKGNTYNHSKFNLSTSNMENLICEAVYSNKALKRRFDQVYVVCPKAEFCTESTKGSTLWDRKYDFSKLPKGSSNVSSVHPMHLEFHERNLVDDYMTGRILSFDEVVKQALDTYHLKDLQYKQYKEELLSTGSFYRSMYTVPQGGFFPEEAIRETETILEDIQRYCPDDLDNTFFFHFERVISDYYDDDYRKYQDVFRFCHDLCYSLGLVEHDHPTTFSLRYFYDVFGRRFLIDVDELEFSEVECLYGPEFQKRIRSGNYTIPTLVIEDSVSGTTEAVSSAFAKFKEFIKKQWMSLIGISEFLIELIMENSTLFFAGLAALFAFLGYRNSSSIDHVSKNFDMLEAELIKIFKDVVDLKLEKEDIQKQLRFIIQDKGYDKSLCIDSILKMRETEKKMFDRVFPEMGDDQILETLDLAVPQSVNANARGRGSKNQNITIKHYLQNRLNAKPQFGEPVDRNGEEILKSIINKNLWYFEVEEEPNSGIFKHQGYLLQVQGCIGLIPAHFMTTIIYRMSNTPGYSKRKIRLTKAVVKNDRAAILFDISEFTDNMNADLEGSDLLFVRLKKLHTCRSILKFIPTRLDLEKFNNFYSAIFIKRDDELVIKYGEARFNYPNHPVNAVFGKYSIEESYQYYISTEVGDCGSPIMLANPSMATAKLFGIHVAGTDSKNGFGFAGALFQEDVLKILEQYEFVDIVDEQWDYDFDPVDFPAGQDRFQVQGACEITVSQGSKTDICRSLLDNNWCDIKTAPAILSSVIVDGVLHDPFEIALSNYCTPDVVMNKKFISAISNSVYDSLLRNSKPFPKRIFTWHEALFGIDGEPNFKSLNRAASPGFPDNAKQVKGYKGKEFYMGKGSEMDYEGNCVSLFEECNLLEAKIISGVRPTFIFTDCLKDERRPIEKVKQVKTRAFSGAPLRYLLLIRKWFGAFMVWYTSNRIVNNSGVGINPNSLDWHLLATKLLEKCKGKDGIGAGDYSKYDGSEKGTIHWAILDVINKWYNDGEQNANIRKVLWFEVVNSRHIRNEVVYDWNSSLPSGHPLTTIINNLYNAFAFRYCWIMLNDDDTSSLFEFDDHVYCCFFGDDNLFSVSPEYQSLFTEKFLEDSMKSLGLTYTAEDKGVISDSLRPLEKVSFLKRSFRYCDIKKRWLAPLQLDVILEIPCWTKNRHDKVEITVANCESAIFSLSLHGDKVFNEYTPKIAEALNKAHGKWPRCTDFLQSLEFSTERLVDFF
jgi:hypothetical protein